MDYSAYLTTWHVTYGIVMIPILFGNSLILVSIAKYRNLRTNMHILIGNLAVSDLIVGGVLIPWDIVTDITGQNISTNMCLCLGKLALFVISYGSSCFNLLLISIERFVAIVYPLHLRKYFTRSKMMVMIVIGWVTSAINGTMPLYGWNAYNANNTECVSDTIWTPGYKLMVNWELVAALMLNFTLYTIVMRIALRNAKSRRIVGQSFSVRTHADKDLHQMVTMVIVLGLFALCWFPYICSVLVVTFYETSYTQFIRRCTLIPGLANSSLNWIVYGYRNSDFRKAFKAILKVECIGKCSVSQPIPRNNNVSPIPDGGVSVIDTATI